MTTATMTHDDLTLMTASQLLAIDSMVGDSLDDCDMDDTAKVKALLGRRRAIRRVLEGRAIAASN